MSSVNSRNDYTFFVYLIPKRLNLKSSRTDRVFLRKKSCTIPHIFVGPSAYLHVSLSTTAAFCQPSFALPKMRNLSVVDRKSNNCSLFGTCAAAAIERNVLYFANQNDLCKLEVDKANAEENASFSLHFSL